MVSLVAALRESAGRMRDLLSASHHTHLESIFYISCRIQDGQAKKYRITILVRSQSIAEAESLAKLHLHDLLSDARLDSSEDLSIRWLKPRPLSSHPRKDESATTVQLLSKLRRDQRAVISAVDSIDAA